MASLQQRGKSWRLLFNYKSRQHTLTIGEVSEVEAHAWKGKVELLLLRLKQNLLTLPAGCDICTFLEHDGKPPEPKLPAEQAPARKREVTLGQLREDYLATHRSSLEANTLKTIEIHFNHLLGCLGEKTPLAALSLKELQTYVQSREGKVEPGTIKMEVITLRTAWNWGVRFNLAEGDFPGAGLRYPKAKEKPPFMTYQEAQRRIEQGATPEEMWECLYLTPEELQEVLALVKQKAIQPWVYPMAVTAAHTGARRSELIRALAQDVDLAGGVLTIREKKKRKGMDSTRRAPMSSLLLSVLGDYQKDRPAGCPFLFYQEARVTRSKKKREGATPVTKDEAHNHLERALSGSKWEVLKGWHVFRHSCISALANRGVDQRVIQDMVGHMTAEMQRRYAHLYPSTKQAAIRSVFG